MKLPNAHLAVVEHGKIVDYLLNPSHRFGTSKARFFGGFGFKSTDWEKLADGLREVGQSNEVRKERETGFGPRYEVVGEIKAPDDRRPNICTVWQVDKGQLAPRLITAYPFEGK